MKRRRHEEPECECPGRYGTGGPYSQSCTAQGCLDGGAPRCHHHFGCPLWGLIDDCDTRNEFRPFKSILGSKRTPYEKWSKTFSPYPWPLWRHWTAPEPVKVETLAEQRKRQLRHRPAGYDWKLWHERKGERAAHAAYLAERWKDETPEAWRQRIADTAHAARQEQYQREAEAQTRWEERVRRMQALVV